jgi:hypothetical protein
VIEHSGAQNGELANTLEMTDEQLCVIYPDGPKALPPELEASPPKAGA